VIFTAEVCCAEKEEADCRANEAMLSPLKEGLVETNLELARHRAKLSTLLQVPSPRSVKRSKKKPIAGLIPIGRLTISVKMEFGCYRCEREGVTIDSAKVSSWAKLILASANSVPPLIEGNLPGFAKKVSKLSQAMNDVWKGTDGKYLEEYQEIAHHIFARNDADNDVAYVI